MITVEILEEIGFEYRKTLFSNELKWVIGEQELEIMDTKLTVPVIYYNLETQTCSTSQGEFINIQKKCETIEGVVEFIKSINNLFNLKVEVSNTKIITQKMELKYLKTREVESPVRGDGGLNDLSAGLDFFVPEFDEDFVSAFKDKNTDTTLASIEGGLISVEPFGRCLIPTGLKMNLQTIDGVLYDVDNGVALVAFNRGSLGSKGIVHGACVVDEDYQGELFMSIINTQNRGFEITSGAKLLQFLLIPILTPRMVEVENTTELFPTVSKRGEGALGSTNK